MQQPPLIYHITQQIGRSSHFSSLIIKLLWNVTFKTFINITYTRVMLISILLH